MYLAYKPFFLFECYECRKKTIYCQFCGKVLNKLFNDLFFKCANCNKITRTVSKELVESTSPQQTKANLFDYRQLFGNSVIANDSCVKNLFGNSLNEGSLMNKTNNPFATPKSGDLNVLTNTFTVINSNKPSVNLFVSSNSMNAKKRMTSQFAGLNKSETKKEFLPCSLRKHKNKSPIVNSYDNKKCKSFGKPEISSYSMMNIPSAFTFGE